MTPVGGMVKEFGQALGLPDLAARRENPGSEGLGVWCALSNPFATGRPQHTVLYVAKPRRGRWALHRFAPSAAASARRPARHARR